MYKNKIVNKAISTRIGIFACIVVLCFLSRLCPLNYTIIACKMYSMENFVRIRDDEKAGKKLKCKHRHWHDLFLILFPSFLLCM